MIRVIHSATAILANNHRCSIMNSVSFTMPRNIRAYGKIMKGNDEGEEQEELLSCLASFDPFCRPNIAHFKVELTIAENEHDESAHITENVNNDDNVHITENVRLVEKKFAEDRERAVTTIMAHTILKESFESFDVQTSAYVEASAADISF